MIKAYEIFDPSSIPDKSDETFKDYGNEEINTLADHFFTEKNETKQLESQWLQTKHFIKKKTKTRFSTVEMSFLCLKHSKKCKTFLRGNVSTVKIHSRGWNIYPLQQCMA